MLFEYECMSCANKIEIIQKSKDSPPVCSSCGAAAMKKLFPSRTSFILKGKCWARDGYSK